MKRFLRFMPLSLLVTGASLLAMDNPNDAQLQEAQRLTQKVGRIINNQIKSPASLRTLASLALSNPADQLLQLPEELRHSAVLRIILADAFRNNNLELIATDALNFDDDELLSEVFQMGLEWHTDRNAKLKNKLLWQAILKGSIKCLQLLIAMKADINQDYCGQLPLMLATKIGREACVAALINAGANVNCTDNNGLQIADNRSTPLILAANYGMTSIVNILINAGASLDLRDRWNNRALYYALRDNHIECVDLLRQAYAKATEYVIKKP